MKKQSTSLVLAASLLLSACSGMSDTQQRTLSGTAIGAGGGAIIGAMAGNAGLGALIGAGAGAVGGYVWDQHKKAEESAYQQGYSAGQKSPTTAQ